MLAGHRLQNDGRDLAGIGAECAFQPVEIVEGNGQRLARVAFGDAGAVGQPQGQDSRPGLDSRPSECPW